MDKTSSKQVKEEEKPRPSPDEFDEFLPWACNQLQVEESINIVRVVQNEYISMAQTDRSKSKSKSRAKLTPSQAEVTFGQNNQEKSLHALQGWVVTENIIRVLTIYDSIDNLIHVKFDNNLQVPQIVVKIIGMIAKFQIYLTAFTINKGLTAPTLYEICKFLPKSYITDLFLDNTVLPEANYHILLENQNFLRNLSLARCKINDVVVEKIAANLVHPLPASRTLSLLNLSSNMITDVGAKHLGNALRCNRQLTYLNLADNSITDDGAEKIFNNLMEFPLTYDEVIEVRTRHVTYLKEKNEMISKIMKELKAGDFERKFAKKKSAAKPTSASSGKKGKIEREGSLKSCTDSKSQGYEDAILYEKAANMAEATIGEFVDPWGATETISKNGIVYCIGNNTLSYINLAYNNLSYFSVKKLLNVLMYQKFLNRKPRGIINLCIEGNNLPASCKELNQLDEFIQMGLLASRRLSGVARRRPQSRK